MYRILTAFTVLMLTATHGSVAAAPSGSISGRVSSSDKRITDFLGVQVYIPGTSYQSRADRAGYFTIANVSPGTYDVQVSPPNDRQIGTMGEARVTEVTVRPNVVTTIHPTMVPVVPRLLKVEPSVVDRDTPIRIQGDNLGADRFVQPCTVHFWGIGTNPYYYGWQDARTFTIPTSEVAALRRRIAEIRDGKVEVKAYCMGAWSNPLEVEFRQTAAPTPPVASYTGPPKGIFTPGNAMAGDTVTLSGQARPGSFMSVYFDGRTHVGVARVDQDGNYSLPFQVPPTARPGAAYVAAGCDTCGNGWTNFRGLTIGSAGSGADPAAAGRGARSLPPRRRTATPLP